MKILYVGDVMGSMGVKALEQGLDQVRKDHRPDIVVVQSENVTDGRGISAADYKKLQSSGIDFFSGGNWSLSRQDIYPNLDDPNQPIVRPANYPQNTPGKSYKILQTARGPILFVSLLGQIVGKDADRPTENPLKTIDIILTETKHIKFIAKIVNFHGDYSSEKRVIGYYLDGRVTAVIGDHWHVPTADAMILPKGTAHITDVGMCGSLDSSLGVRTDIIITRWRDGKSNRNQLETNGRLQFNAVLIEIDNKSGLADSIQSIQHLFD